VVVVVVVVVVDDVVVVVVVVTVAWGMTMKATSIAAVHAPRRIRASRVINKQTGEYWQQTWSRHLSQTFLKFNKKKKAKQLLTLPFCFRSTFGHSYP
jgi:hypothetical protein